MSSVDGVWVFIVHCVRFTRCAKEDLTMVLRFLFFLSAEMTLILEGWVFYLYVLKTLFNSCCRNVVIL